MDRNANVFEFKGSKMIVNAKGPNINKNFTMNTSFRPNMWSSTMNMPRNFEKLSSTVSVTSQKSVYHGRDTSPTASLCSDRQPRNFYQPFYQGGSSQRSVYNREGSPMSIRSIDSTASRADSVIDEIKTWGKDELDKLWHAVNKKREYMKKAQRRRKMKTLQKNLQNRSEDEGELGSRSSISNDDCASTRTGFSQRYDPHCKENVPRNYCQSEDTDRGNRDAYTSYGSQDPYQIGTNKVQPRVGHTYFSHKNGYPQNERIMYSQSNTGYKNNFFSQRCLNGPAIMSSMQRNHLNGSMYSTKSIQNMTMMSQRDRFRSGFQFPSQKFNQSTLQEEHIRKEKTNQRDHIDELSDENDDIFLDTSVKPKTVTKKTEKRKVESLGDIPNPTKKKPKMTSSNDKPKKQGQNKDVNEKNEFEFVKPQFPVRKSAHVKPLEKLISKSSGAPDFISDTQENNMAHPRPASPSPETDGELEQSENTQLTTSDMSMRPSFMKRKLFTQTLDVTEKKNNSFESGTDSPQSNIYSALNREKHKTRKLVNSQSLLSRDVNQDNDNLLDLIHKIVPPNQVNSSITANTSKLPNSRTSETKNANGDDKWDITSIISICNNDSVSETYTDDEIFRVSNEDKKSKVQEKPLPGKCKRDDKNIKPKPAHPNAKAKVEIKKTENNSIPTNNKNGKEVMKNMTLSAAPMVPKDSPARRVVLSRSSRLVAFWDTDGSDYEDQPQEHIASAKKTSTGVQAKTSLTKGITKQTELVHPIVVLRDIQKEVNKQPCKKVPNKTKNEPKASKKSSDITKARKSEKAKKDTPTFTPRTRKQLNQSALSEIVNNPLNEKDTSVNKTAPAKNATQKKKNNEKKATRESKSSPIIKNNQNKKQNDTKYQINISKKDDANPKSQRAEKIGVKTTKLREPAEHLKIAFTKELRSRIIDTSSSFNSDKFELTMARTRNSRSPRKRISFNKSRDFVVNNIKIRSRATKS